MKEMIFIKILWIVAEESVDESNSYSLKDLSDSIALNMITQGSWLSWDRHSLVQRRQDKEWGPGGRHER